VVVVLGDVVRAARIRHEPDEALKRVAFADRLFAEVAAKSFSYVRGFGASCARGETLERPLGCFVEVELLSPHTSEYTSTAIAQ
jgi:hypothetical protein